MSGAETLTRRHAAFTVGRVIGLTNALSRSTADRPARIWLDGALVEWQDARIHVLTHAFHYGTGVFEGIRCYETPEGPAIFRLADHLARLERSGRAILMPIPYSRNELAAATRHVVSANGFGSCYIRVVAFRGPGDMGINPDLAPVSVSIAAWEQAPSFSPERRAAGIRTSISSWRRHDPNVVPPQAKILGAYVNAAIARAEAVRAGFDEALMLAPNGNVSEGTIVNLFLVRDGVLDTPPLSDGPLAGITRDTVMTLAAELGIISYERSLTRADLYAADELFVVGTGAEIVGVREVDGRALGKPGPITQAISRAYEAVVHGTAGGHRDWLEPVGRLVAV